MVVDRIRADEADLLRRVRLSALADAPTAFASTHQREAAFDASEWERRATAASSGAVAASFFARDTEGDVIGLVGVFENGVEPATAELVSMWVAPAGRGRGVGAALVVRAIDWARDAGYARIELWVTRSNDAAERLYRKVGFTETGDVKPLPSDPCKDELRMRLDL